MVKQTVKQKPEDENEVGIGTKDLYLTPKDYLILKIPVDLEHLNMKSRLSIEDFGFCLQQWSLKCVSDGWEYSSDDEIDLKRLRAGFEKWLNSWVKNDAKKVLKPSANSKSVDSYLSVNQAAKKMIHDQLGND